VLQDEPRPTATINPATGKTPNRLYHSVDVIRPNRGKFLVTSYNDRYELAEPFLKVFPKCVACCICQEAADLWFMEGALAIAAEMRLTMDLEGNWDGGWMTASNAENLTILEGYTSDLSDNSNDPPVLPLDNSTRPPMLATTNNSSVKTYGTLFGRGQEPAAAEEAAALSVDSVSPAGLPGATAPEGGGPSD